MRDLKKELVEALDKLEKAHEEILKCNAPEKLKVAMAVIRSHFNTAQDIVVKLMVRAEGGDVEAHQILTELDSRAEKSFADLQKSQAHVLKVFTNSAKFHFSDSKKLPRA